MCIQCGDIPVSHAVNQIIYNSKKRQGNFYLIRFAGHKSVTLALCDGDVISVTGHPGRYHMYDVSIEVCIKQELGKIY